MTEFIVRESNIDEQDEKIAYSIAEILASGGEAGVTVVRKNNGTLPMLKVWRMWMADIAKYQVDRGAKMPILAPKMNPDGELEYVTIDYRKFNADDAHEAYTHLFLGSDESGKRYSWVLNKNENEGRIAASLGQRLDAMRRFHLFCVEKGIPIRIPQRNEYSDLIRNQDE